MAGKAFKRLFFDIEVSPNIVFSWNIGHEVNLSYENILKERAIICICYKFEGSDKVYHLSWNKGDDKQMLEKFAKVLNTCDEVIGHNGDKFDIRWVRTRCLYHGISITPYIKSIDTLKESRGKFKFNSNRLDYIAQYLGLGKKLETGYHLWKDIVLKNSKSALKDMITYCKQDVVLLEGVFQKLNAYLPPKTNIASQFEREIIHCHECLSENTIINKYRITAGGTRSVIMHCNDCGKYFSISETKLKKAVKSANINNGDSE